jgi:anti-anti-sigma regulatory factor
LDNRTASDLLAGLRKAAAGGGHVALDASQVETVSTSCLQILLAAARSPAEAGSYRLAAASPALVEIAAEVGLESHISEWLARDERTDGG